MKNNKFDRKSIAKTKRWIIKVGSSLITADGKGIDADFIDNLVAQVVALSKEGIVSCIVSSGSVVEGSIRLGMQPKLMTELQAVAAVGQVGLMQQFERSFAKYCYQTAQILLTHEDLANRRRYLNAKATIRTLLNLQVVPVINENDTVANDEIKFGDNDSLAGMIANLVEADVLVLLTDKEGLYKEDPSINPDTEFITSIDCSDPLLDSYAGQSRSGLGRGGMITKIRSARLAARSGASTIIVSGRQHNILQRILAGEQVGSLLQASLEPIAAKRQWIAGQLRTKGKLYIDQGAANAVLTKGVSLLPVGVVRLEGQFQRGDLVDCVNDQGKVIARGLVSYNYEETHKILKADSRQIKQRLGYIIEPELIHRDNLVLM